MNYFFSVFLSRDLSAKNDAHQILLQIGKATIKKIFFPFSIFKKRKN